MEEWIVLTGIGLSAGLLAGLLGIGGGLVIVPALGFLLMSRGMPMDVSIPMAVGTALASMLLTSAASAIAHARRGNVDWPTVFRLGPSVAVGAVLGAFVATLVSGEELARVFALIAGVIGVRMLLALSIPGRDLDPAPRGWFLAGPGIGAVSAMIGIGGGSFNVPYLVFNGYSTLRAVGVAAACGWPIALGGSLVLLMRQPPGDAVSGAFGHWYLPGVILIGLGGVFAAPWGARLAHRLGSAGLSRLFGMVLLLVAIRMSLPSG